MPVIVAKPAVPSLAALLLAPLLAAQDRPTGADLLDQSQAATTGKAGYDKFPGLAVTGVARFKLTRFPDREFADGSFAEYLHPSGRFYSATEFAMGKFENGFDGQVAWEIDPTSGVRVLEGKRREDLLRHWRMMHESWRKLYAKAECTGETKVHGRPHWIVKATAKTGTLDTLYLDKETKLAGRLDSKMPTPDGEQDVTVLMSDYRVVDGVQITFKRLVKMPTVTIEFEVERAEHTAEFPEGILDLPLAVAQQIVKQRIEQAEPKPAAKAGDDTIVIRDVKEQHAATIRLRVRGDEVGQKLAIIFPEIAAHLMTLDGVTLRQPFTRWLEKGVGEDGDEFELEAGFPVRKKIAAKGRIKPTKLPAARVARTIHIGPYHELPRTWTRVDEWMKSRKLEAAGPAWEYYLTDPAIEPDPQKWRTECFFPIRPIVRIETAKKTHVASIRVTTTPAQLAETFAACLPEVVAFLEQKGIPPAGPAFGRYHKFGADAIDLECGVPVAKPIEGEGRIKASTLPATKTIWTWHVGHYTRLAATYGFLRTQTENRKLVVDGAPWEFYVVDPGEEPDPSKWETRIVWPVKDAKK